MENDNRQMEMEVIFNKHKGVVKSLLNRICQTSLLSTEDREDLCSSAYTTLWECILNMKNQDDKGFKRYIYIRIRGAILDALKVRQRNFHRNHTFAMRIKLIIEASATSKRLESTRYEETKSLESVYDKAYEYALKYQLIEVDRDRGVSFNSSTVIDKRDKKACLSQYIKKLSTREKLIIKEYYMEDKSFAQICLENPKLSKTWVSKIHKRAIRKLKEFSLENDGNELERMMAN